MPVAGPEMEAMENMGTEDLIAQLDIRWAFGPLPHDIDYGRERIWNVFERAKHRFFANGLCMFGRFSYSSDRMPYIELPYDKARCAGSVGGNQNKRPFDLFPRGAKPRTEVRVAWRWLESWSVHIGSMFPLSQVHAIYHDLSLSGNLEFGPPAIKHGLL